MEYWLGVAWGWLAALWDFVVSFGWWWLLVWFVVACVVASGWSWGRTTGRYDGPGVDDDTVRRLRDENTARRERLARLADDPGSRSAGVGGEPAQRWMTFDKDGERHG